MKYQRILLIVFLVLTQSFVTCQQPERTVHATGEVLIMGDSILDAARWIVLYWLCFHIWTYDKKKKREEKENGIE
jgi:hypothetical protein